MLPLTLIKTIVSTHMILGKIDNEQNLYEARRLYEGIKQGERETLDNYCQRFEAAVASLTEAAARAGMDTETPGENSKLYILLGMLMTAFRCLETMFKEVS